jgi:hypothetical protein
MTFAKANEIDRKFGGAEGRDLQLLHQQPIEAGNTTLSFDALGIHDQGSKVKPRVVAHEVKALQESVFGPCTDSVAKPGTAKLPRTSQS